jgi:hypothetical protein
MSAHHTASQGGPALRNSIDTLPVEVVNQIFSYLIHPRSRLPGLTEAQSHHTVSGPTRIAIRCNEEFTTPANTDPWAANLFTISFTQHPFNALALASRRCHKLVESYSGHLVRICNPFNLPFALFDQHGSSSVWPDLSGIVYRRLWLQHAPRKCVYCDAVIDQYPFPVLKRLVTACGRCFYLLTLVSCTPFPDSSSQLLMCIRRSMRLSDSITSRLQQYLPRPLSGAIANQSISCARTSKPWLCSCMARELSTMRMSTSGESHVQSAPSPSLRQKSETTNLDPVRKLSVALQASAGGPGDRYVLDVDDSVLPSFFSSSTRSPYFLTPFFSDTPLTSCFRSKRPVDDYTLERGFLFGLTNLRPHGGIPISFLYEDSVVFHAFYLVKSNISVCQNTPTTV